MAFTSLVSTAIWFPMLMHSLQVGVNNQMNCNEPGSLAATVSRHNEFLEMLQRSIADGLVGKMVMPDVAAQFQQAEMHHTNLPTWCASTDNVKEELLTNVHRLLYLYLLPICASQIWTLLRGYTHNSLIFYSKIMWLFSCGLSYNQSMLNIPFINASNSVPMPGFLESYSMAILLASSIFIPSGKVTEQTEETVQEQEQTDMKLAESQGTVMGGVSSMMHRTSTMDSVMSAASSVGSRLSTMAARISDRFQRMLSGF